MKICKNFPYRFQTVYTLKHALTLTRKLNAQGISYSMSLSHSSRHFCKELASYKRIYRYNSLLIGITAVLTTVR